MQHTGQRRPITLPCQIGIGWLYTYTLSKICGTMLPSAYSWAHGQNLFSISTEQQYQSTYTHVYFICIFCISIADSWISSSPYRISSSPFHKAWQELKKNLQWATPFRESFFSLFCWVETVQPGSSCSKLCALHDDSCWTVSTSTQLKRLKNDTWSKHW
jgi:hypothetical protein